MDQPSIAELRQMAREVFGRELTEGEAEAYRARLPGMVRVVSVLREWEERLRDIGPATVHRMPVADTDDTD